MLSAKQTIKYTATISEESIQELKMLAEKKVIPSVNYAIREAIEEYIVLTKKQLYEKQMQEAAEDEQFQKRTLDCGKDFTFVDSEVVGSW
jgi:hypothetical protein